MSIAISKAWVFASSSGDRQYQTLLYADGSTSCDCKGWTRRVARDGSRTCKHVRLVEMGIADSQCLSSLDYRSAKPPPPKPHTPEPPPSAPAVRRFQFDEEA